MICPGCMNLMENGALMGVWFDRAGRPLKLYVLCTNCASIVYNGTDAQRTEIAERVEMALTEAGATN